MQETDKKFNIEDSPSGFVASEADRLHRQFTNVSIISTSDIFFVGRGIRFGRWYAIKGLNEGMRNDEAGQAILNKEFEILLELNHPNIRKVVDKDTVNDLGECIIMEYVEGDSLLEWLKSPRSLEERKKVAFQLLDAIEYLHGRGLVHRDLKPANILVTRIGGSVKLIDFGLSDADKFAVLKNPAGTDGYASPEQKASSRPDPKNDIYSIGKIFAHLLPEREFSDTIKACLRPAKERPANVSAIRKLLDNKRNRKNRIFWLAGAGIIVLALAITLPLTLKSGRETPEAQPADDTQQAPVEQVPEGEFLENVSIAEPNLADIEIPQPQPKQNAISPEPAVSSPAGRVDGNRADPEYMALLEKIYGTGIHTIDLVWEDTAMKYLKSLGPGEEAPAVWNMQAIYLVKDSYVSSIEYSVNNTTSLTDRYYISQEDISYIDKRLNGYIKSLYEKWKAEAARKKSGQ